MHHLIKKSFNGLYPDEEMNFEAKIKYSRAFKGYNANVKYARNMTNFEFRLSHEWKDVSDEIKIGLLQNLFNKIYNTDVKTLNIDLYNIFLKKIPAVTPKTKSAPLLAESFSRVNETYFHGLMIQPNLEFGGRNFHTLGTYEYSTDTIRISQLLKKDTNLLDYVMYHELLHKKFKYKNTAKRTIHHSKKFREEEKKYKDKDIEDKLKKFIRKEKFKEKFWF